MTESKRVLFEFNAAPGSEVYVAGTFNDWNPAANPLKANSNKGHFKAALSLPKGTYEYKFIVNGQWLIDPRNDKSVPNAAGSFNNVLRV